MEEGIASAGSTAAADAAQSTANTALTTANSAVTKANNAQTAVNAALATTEPVTGGFTPASGWKLNRGGLIKVGRLASCDISVVRTGGTITVGPSGNITNTLLGTVTNAFKNWSGYQGIATGPGGSLNSIYINGTNVYLAAYAPSVNINNDMEISFAGPWITAS